METQAGAATIAAMGIAVPRYRLSCDATGAPLRRPVAIAGEDEDSLTLAVDAAMACPGLRSHGHLGTVEALYMATTTAPLAEGSPAAIAAAALDLTARRTADLGGSLRAATSALMSAVDGIAAGSFGSALVLAADTRAAAPGSELDGQLGAAGAAVLLRGHDGSSGAPSSAGVSILAQLSQSHAIGESWRSSEHTFIRRGDPRFGSSPAFLRDAAEVGRRVLDQAGCGPTDIDAAALGVADGRAAHALAKALGLSPRSARPEPTVGHTGTPHPLLLLADALRSARPGQRILVLALGNGTDALVLQVGEGWSASALGPAADLEALHATDATGHRGALTQYSRYLALRHLLPGRQRLDPFGSVALAHRDEALDLRLRSRRCKACTTISTLPLPVCTHCGARDAWQPHPLQRTGSIFTFTIEHYYPAVERPTGMVVLDLDGGGRMVMQATDCDTADLSIGAPMELTLRRLHDGGGRPTYYWKCRPSGESGPERATDDRPAGERARDGARSVAGGQP